MNRGALEGAAASWSAPVPWRFCGRATIESARGLARSKTWRRVDGSWRDQSHSDLISGAESLHASGDKISFKVRK
jgi:hypothetical protein